MTTITFDTDAIIQRLRRAGLTEEQAREFVQAVRDAQSELVTKDDLKIALEQLKHELLLKLGSMLIGGFGLLIALKIFG